MLDEKDLQAIKTMMDDQKNELVGMMNDQKKELDARMDKLDTRMDKLDARIDKLDARMDKLDTKSDEIMNNFRIIIETEVNPKFELVLEGYENLMQTLAPKRRVDELEEKVTFLHGIVQNLMLDVAELKKAK
jgi:uncharacterized coiled-coil DUF342 family protein